MRRTYLFCLFCLLLNLRGYAQEHVVVEEYLNQEVITAAKTITFKNGFFATSGTTLHAYINQSNNGVKNRQKPDVKLNYVAVYDVRQPGIVNPFDSTNYNTVVNVDIGYVDGQGRPVGTIGIKGSPGNNSAIQYRQYDELGREATQYLPYSKVG
ncbi:MAG TPA: DUF6443 domain-containing protein, partial [Pedobacter sp.]|nr:DUF6443 domain-containing protein [Pedobacter sp.]